MSMEDHIMNSGVCEFTFDELCRKPAGASDYISICNHSIVNIEHIYLSSISHIYRSY